MFFCGKSPAADFGTKLHIDYIVSFSKGGKGTLEKLQTFCENAILGKAIDESKGDKREEIFIEFYILTVYTLLSNMLQLIENIQVVKFNWRLL